MLFFGSSNRGFEKESDIVPEKSSIGLISSRISCSPEADGRSSWPSASAVSTRACQRELPSSQSKLSIWSARRLGTSRGSRILAKEMRRGLLVVVGAVRVAAKSGPSEGSRSELSADVTYRGHEGLRAAQMSSLANQAHCCRVAARH